MGEAFFIDIYACSGTNDLRVPVAYILIIVYFVLCVSLHFVESSAFRFHVTKLRKRTIKHKSLLSKRLYKHSQSLQKDTFERLFFILKDLGYFKISCP